MKLAAVILLALSPAVLAQSPTPVKPLDSPVLQPCADCGVVTSVKRIEKSTLTQPNAVDKSKPSGLVANIPLGKGGGKATVGSSTDLRENERPPVVTYEIIVRMDDGRFRVLTQPDADNLNKGDNVKVVEGKAVLR